MQERVVLALLAVLALVLAVMVYVRMRAHRDNRAKNDTTEFFDSCSSEEERMDIYAHGGSQSCGVDGL